MRYPEGIPILWKGFPKVKLVQRLEMGGAGAILLWHVTAWFAYLCNRWVGKHERNYRPAWDVWEGGGEASPLIMNGR